MPILDKPLLDKLVLDEMVDGRGGVRPHWRGVLGVLSSMDPGRLAERATRLALAAEEEGAPASRRLDPVPFPISTEEFAALEDGLCQRATLLEAVLADLYGPQALVAEGAIPPALVFANPAFLRPLRGSPAPGGRFLHAYAADLVRGPDGAWQVVADRTGGVPGIGYARGNRRLLARVLPELFRPTQVRQLRPFFEAWQDALLQAAPHPDGRVPYVALLTPGVTDPHWPEHLALSRDLNCALVEARDLTVRAGTLHLRTLLGLQPIDILLRRLPGDAIDPLELHAPGAGVTGLLDAARTGAVHILNHPGAALAEAPALAAYLPSLCQHLLGQPLHVASLATLWLGADGALQAVRSAPARWDIRPALDPLRAPVALAALTPSNRAALEAAVAARPWDHAASETVMPSVAPCFIGGGLIPRPVALRLFLVHDGAGWRMMQGGLARVLAQGEHPAGGIQADAVFKDVWVPSLDRTDIQGPVPVRQPPLAIRRSFGNLPSRVADDFFWLGRYVERLDVQARLARAGLQRSARGAPLPREVAETRTLLTCLAQVGMVDDEDGSPLPKAVQLSLLPDGAAASGLANAAWLLQALRDRMTPETHAAITQAQRAAQADMDEAQPSRGANPGGGQGVDSLLHAMTGLQRLANTLAGVASEGMVRGGGWLFLDLGRRIERAYLSTQMLATALDQPAARMEGTLQLLLELCDSVITYQSRYMTVLQPGPVLDLVLADADNPRALAYQFAQAARMLAQAGCPALAAEADGLLRRTEALVTGVLDACRSHRAAPPRCPRGCSCWAGARQTCPAASPGGSLRCCRRCKRWGSRSHERTDMRLTVHHSTAYAYADRVELAGHQLHLRPRSLPWQRVLEFELRADPVASRLTWGTDHFGNSVAWLFLDSAHAALTLQATSLVEVLPRPAPDPGATLPWEEVAQLARHGASGDAAEFAFGSPKAPALPAAGTWAAPSFPPGRPVLAGLLDLMARLGREFRFQPGVTGSLHPRRPRAGAAGRGLPGLRALDDRRAARPGAASALCVGLHPDAPAAGPGAAARGGPVPCLGRLLAGA